MVKWLYNHYALTGLISIYYMVLIGYGTVQVFSDITAITSGAAGAYAALMGLPAAAGAIIRWRIDRDNPQD